MLPLPTLLATMLDLFIVHQKTRGATVLYLHAALWWILWNVIATLHSNLVTGSIAKKNSIY
jgi:hypothetical protein